MQDNNKTKEANEPRKIIRGFEAHELPLLGWIQITEIGEENIYFTFGSGLVGYYKYLG